jgi:hypothetical protein
MLVSAQRGSQTVARKPPTLRISKVSQPPLTGTIDRAMRRSIGQPFQG